MTINIGDKFFVFDENRRIYEKDENGRAKGGPTFRGHFVPVEIVGETSRSWIVGAWKQKVDKRDPFKVLFTEEMIESAEWVQVHNYKIRRAIETIRDADTLKKVADLIGYKG